MASLDLTRLMNNARVHLPGAIDANLQLELFNLFNDFFQDSNIWQEDITFQVKALDADDTTYFIEQESVSTINRLLCVMNSADQPVAATMQVPGEILLGIKAGTDDTLTATVGLTVNDPVAASGANAGFPEFPAWILNKYGTGLLEGLLGRMMAQPAKPWSNQQMAIFYMRKMAGTTSQAKIDALHKNVNNAQAWRFPQTFASRRR